MATYRELLAVRVSEHKDAARYHEMRAEAYQAKLDELDKQEDQA
jgi:hypothetical protein